MTIKLNRGRAAVAVLAAVAASPAGAAIAITAPSYSQDFNGLGNVDATEYSALPTGWEIYETDTNADGNYTADDGSMNAGDTYAYGPATGAAVADRALGSLRSGSLGPLFGVFFSNGLGSAITQLEIAYTGEMWRLGATGGTDQLDFQYSLNATDGDLDSGTWTDFNMLHFVTPDATGSAGARNGNAAGFRAGRSGTLALNIAAGQTFAFRWMDSDPSGADDGLAVDDFSLRAVTATAPVPEPTTWAMVIAGFGLVGGTLRSRRGRLAIA